MALGVTVVSRLRKDAALFTVPGDRRPGRRGRSRVYGEPRIDLAKRAGQQRGWTTGTFDLYGEPTVKQYKTLVATWRPAGGAIRVVLVGDGDFGNTKTLTPNPSPTKPGEGNKTETYRRRPSRPVKPVQPSNGFAHHCRRR
jgi:hypothetical protein